MFGKLLFGYLARYSFEQDIYILLLSERHTSSELPLKKNLYTSQYCDSKTDELYSA